ncbi:methylmalonate semialdehyde dehydrogenase [acylating] isoform X2 [Arachis ipaensis]|uniref:methylmalonate semialdehyde dehydrogenase [acylating] isoform X2 n=1 Tax=Arachis ipaensis TaxID=130454 RepID=UPI000A2AFB1B|nr:methylmalonate semialdehyde dehydrogenase [acylating] isoform X2 [Arachis ipaensis]
MLREEREKRRRRGKGGRSRAGAAEFAAAVALPCRRKARTARERTAKREGDRISSPRSQRRRRPHRGSTPSRLATAATTKLAVVAIEAEERESVFAKRGRARAHEGEERRKGKEKQKTMNPGEKEEVCSRTVLLCTQISLRVVMVFPAVTVAIAVYAVCSCHHPPRSSHLLTEYYGSGETKKVSWRESQLKGLRRFLIEKEEDILKALMLDLGKHQVEAFKDEIGTLMKSLNFALSNLKYWISGKKAKLPQIALLSSAEIVPEPLGLVLIISSWNFPFGLSLEPLIGAVAAGNTVVLKPSELSPACSSILALGLPNFLDLPIIRCLKIH